MFVGMTFKTIDTVTQENAYPQPRSDDGRWTECSTGADLLRRIIRELLVQASSKLVGFQRKNSAFYGQV